MTYKPKQKNITKLNNYLNGRQKDIRVNGKGSKSRSN